MMDLKQLSLRPISTKRDGGFDGKAAAAAAAAARERSSLANASFRVYYSLRAGAVPFTWESAPGTPKSVATAAVKAAASPAKKVTTVSSAAGATLPPISPPPSYQSFELKGRRCRPRSSWPAAAAGGLVRALLGMLGLKKSHRRSRRRPASYL